MSRRRLTAAMMAVIHRIGLWNRPHRDRATSRRQIRLSALVALALMASLAIPASPAEALQSSTTPTPGHVVDTNDSNQRAVLALRPDGTFAVRRDLGAGWSSFYNVGGSNWKSGDAAILGNGDIHVVAVNSANQLYTQTLYAAGNWGSLALLESGVDASTAPSIAANATELALAVVRTDGTLQTRRYSGTWSGPTGHGTNWANVDIDLADDGDLWFIGTKTDRALKVRKQLNGTWSGIKNLGVATWSLEARPSISATSSDVILSAVKESGRLLTRRQVSGAWQPWVIHGQDTWATVDVALADNGGAWLIGVKDFGRLYTQEGTSSGSWLTWLSHGQDTWAPTASPSISLKSDGKPTFLAVKADGTLYARSKSANWSGWLKMTNAKWETGAGTSQLPPAWVDEAEMVLKGLTFDDFTIGWGPLVGGAASADHLLLTVSDSNGAIDAPWKIYQNEVSEFSVDRFYNEPLNPNETYSLSLIAVNDTDQSDPLTGTIGVFDMQFSGTVTVSDLDGNNGVVYSSADAQGSEPWPWTGDQLEFFAASGWIDGDGVCLRSSTVLLAKVRAGGFLLSPAWANVVIVEEVCSQDGQTISSHRYLDEMSSCEVDSGKATPSRDPVVTGNAVAVATDYCRIQAGGSSTAVVGVGEVFTVGVEETAEWGLDITAEVKRTFGFNDPPYIAWAADIDVYRTIDS